MRDLWKAALALGLAWAPLASAQATPILGHATSTSGDVLYQGLGDLGDGVADGRGTGLISYGPCAFAAGSTTCTITGAYVEDAGSANPGSTGMFEFRTIWLGSGTNPVIARSASPGSDTIQLFSLGSGHFELDLFPSAGGSFHGVFPDVPFSDSVIWNALAGTATCSGAPSTCSIGQVGLVSGAIFSGSISSFVFNLPQPVAEPSIALLLLPLAAVWARRREGVTR